MRRAILVPQEPRRSRQSDGARPRPRLCRQPARAGLLRALEPHRLRAIRAFPRPAEGRHPGPKAPPTGRFIMARRNAHRPGQARRPRRPIRARFSSPNWKSPRAWPPGFRFCSRARATRRDPSHYTRLRAPLPPRCCLRCCSRSKTRSGPSRTPPALPVRPLPPSPPRGSVR